MAIHKLHFFAYFLENRKNQYKIDLIRTYAIKRMCVYLVKDEACNDASYNACTDGTTVSWGGNFLYSLIIAQDRKGRVVFNQGKKFKFLSISSCCYILLRA